MKMTEDDFQNWIPDSGATSHMSGDPGILTQMQTYSGSDNITIGNGTSLPISHIGEVPVNTVYGPLILSNVLHVPDMKKNLLSISHFIEDHDCIFQFTSQDFAAVSRSTRRVIARGSRCGGLYVLEQIKEVALFSNRQITASEDVWHNKLGHCSPQVLERLQKVGLIHVTSKNKELSVCSSCQMARSHKLPFIKPLNSSLDLLDKVHCDLWGPAPVTSVKGFIYYALFVDDSTHFCWFLPLQNKSDSMIHLLCLINI